MAERGREIQSVMKNYTVLFQHLPAFLDDDAAGLVGSATAVKTVTDGFCRSESGGADAEDSVGVIEDTRRRAAGKKTASADKYAQTLRLTNYQDIAL